jgi:hypothetical protein
VVSGCFVSQLIASPGARRVLALARALVLALVRALVLALVRALVLAFVCRTFSFDEG